jgi:hypothetical protein
MKVILSVWFLMALVTGAWAAPLEVRSYRVDLPSFKAAHREVAEDYQLDYFHDEWLGEIVKNAPFESRFLKGVTSMRDCSASD